MLFSIHCGLSWFCHNNTFCIYVSKLSLRVTWLCFVSLDTALGVTEPTHSSLTMFTFTQHLSLSRRRRWKPAQAHWWLGLQLASSGYNVQDHWSLFTLLHWTGWQQNSSVRTQNAVTDCTVYSVQVYSAVYYWCTSGHLVTAPLYGHAQWALRLRM